MTYMMRRCCRGGAAIEECSLRQMPVKGHPNGARYNSPFFEISSVVGYRTNYTVAAAWLGIGVIEGVMRN